MSRANFLTAYPRLVQRLMRWMPRKYAMSYAVGGDYEAFGIIEASLLRQLGLKPEHSVIDVGCGSGRLASQLKDYLKGPYFGIDVVPDLVKYAATVSNRVDWRFETTNGTNIPASDSSADFVCFFSVFTHLMHEETFNYLSEAKRVLKPGGKIVFSFLEFSIPGHWGIFEQMTKKPSPVLNQYMSRDGIDAWAHHLGLRIDLYMDGDKALIDIPHPVTHEDGRLEIDKACFCQSVCVMS